ncbi:hypothetical protein RHS03_09352, partial [Rhizoctonia solani]
MAKMSRIQTRAYAHTEMLDQTLCRRGRLIGQMDHWPPGALNTAASREAMSELENLRIVRCNRTRSPRELSGGLMNDFRPSKMAQAMSSV